MWLERVRLRNVWPNYYTYNMALAACLDGAVKRTYVGAKITTNMLDDAKTEIPCGLKGSYDFYSTLLDSYTKVLARQLVKQLQENWRSARVINSTFLPSRLPAFPLTFLLTLLPIFLFTFLLVSLSSFLPTVMLLSMPISSSCP